MQCYKHVGTHVYLANLGHPTNSISRNGCWGSVGLRCWLALFSFWWPGLALVFALSAPSTSEPYSHRHPLTSQSPSFTPLQTPWNAEVFANSPPFRILASSSWNYFCFTTGWGGKHQLGFPMVPCLSKEEIALGCCFFVKCWQLYLLIISVASHDYLKNKPGLKRKCNYFQEKGLIKTSF